jgi:hypothetical protein
MNTNNHINSGVTTLIKDIEHVVKKGLNNILKDYIDRFELLENTHKQLMTLPSILDELKHGANSNIKQQNIVEEYDKPIFVSIAEMTQDLVKEEVSVFEKTISNLENKCDSFAPLFEKIIECIQKLDKDIEAIKNDKKNDKQKDIGAEKKDNIQLKIEEQEVEQKEAVQELEVQVEHQKEEEQVEEQIEEVQVEHQKEEEQVEHQKEEEQVEEQIEEVQELEEDQEEEQEVEEQEDQKEEDQEEEQEVEEQEDQKEEDQKEEDQKEEVEQEEVEQEEVEQEEEVEVEEEEEEVSDVETENNEEVNEEDLSTVETENEEQDKEEEEEEEFSEIEIDEVTYCTNNEDNGFIYVLTEDGDVGEKVGYLKEGEPFFYADEK